MELYKLNDCINDTFFKLPHELFENKKYYNLSVYAKLLYTFLIDRLSLSKMNYWIDENDYIYVIYTRKELEEKLNISHAKSVHVFKELNDIVLIKEKSLGANKPNVIFIYKLENLKYKNDTSGSINTNNIKNNYIKNNSLNFKLQDERKYTKKNF